MKERTPSALNLTTGTLQTLTSFFVVVILLTLHSCRSKLFVDKKLVVDNDGRRGGVGNKCAAVDLAEGQHPTRVEFFRGDGQASVKATYRLLSSNPKV